MSAGYWKMVGENVAKGVGEKTARRLGTSAKFLGRAGAVVGIGFLAYELFKSYKENIEKKTYLISSILKSFKEEIDTEVSEFYHAYNMGKEEILSEFNSNKEKLINLIIKKIGLEW